MRSKAATLNPALVPLTHGLPTPIAASIGLTLTRHAYLDWVLGQVMYSLMEISVKQGRVILKLPRPRQYVATVKDLYAFHGLQARYDFEGLAAKLEAAERTRRILGRSVYLRDTAARARRILLARGMWDAGPGGESQPEAQVVDRGFLARRRKDVEDAIGRAERLRFLTDRLLRALHEKRRGRHGLDRRR